MNLPEFSVKNSIFGNALFFVVVIVGIIAAVNAQRELFPGTDLDIVAINTVYPGALPEEVENHVTIPIEEQLKGVSGIDEFTSSSVESMSSIGVFIDPDAKNKERVINDIIRKVNRVRFENDRIDEPDIEVIVTREMVIHVCVGGTATEAAIRDYVDYLEAKIAKIPHVGMIMKTGWRDPEIHVDLDAEHLLELELPIFAVSAALRRHNVNFPGGTIPNGSTELVLRTAGEFSTLDDVREVIVRSNEDGNHITVGDIASVNYGYNDGQVRLRADGTRAVMLSVEKKSEGDTITIADAVQALVAEEEDRLPEGIALSMIDFESFVIKRRLRVLLSNGFAGLILVLIALPLLMNVRVAIVTALGIPFAFLTAILVMSYLDISINMLTMFAMILVVGMLVDDAIIMAENIFRHLERGDSPRDAAIQGAKEVMWPVTCTVLTTIAAFLPLAFLPGIMGKFMKWIPIVVMITLAASLFEALVILPCHVAHMAKSLKKSGNGDGNGDDEKHGGKGSEWSDKLQGKYEAFLRRVLRHRGVFMAIAVSCFIAAVGFAKVVMVNELFPADLIDIFYVSVTSERGSTLDTTEAIMEEVERRLVQELDEEELDMLLAEVGHHRDQHMASFTRGSRYGMIWVYLSPAQEREKSGHRSAQEIIRHMRKVCADVSAETIKFDMVKPGPPGGKEIDVRIVGAELEALDGIADEIKGYLGTIDGVLDIEDSYEPGKDELVIRPSTYDAGRMGLDAESVAMAAYTAFQGAEATSIRDAREETQVMVRLKEEDRTVENLLTLKIPNKKGRLVSLSSVTEITEGTGVSGISHFDGDRSVSVVASIQKPGSSEDGEDGLNIFQRITHRIKTMLARLKSKKDLATVDSVNESIDEKFDDLPDRFPGYRMVRSGEYEDNKETQESMLRAFVIALILIYAILVVQFKSVIQPWAILIAIPFGLIGVILALFVHGKPISFMAMLGMVGMTGVVVNDAIVLVSFINDLRRQGVGAQEAVVKAAAMRLRPILLTSVTTVLGLAPVIYGLGGYEPFVAPAAIVLAYGLVFATVLTLLLVPCVYSLGIDARIWFIGKYKQVTGSP